MTEDSETTDQKRTVRDGYDQLGSEYDARRTDDPEDAAFLDELRGRIPADGRVLDAGCGAGRPVAEALAADFDLVGLDLSREQVRTARERVPAPGDGSVESEDRTADSGGRADSGGCADSGGRFVQGDMTALPLADESVDAIAAYHSVIHVPTDEHPVVSREFARVLRPGGHLLMTVGAGAWEGTNDDWLETGVEMRWSIPAPEESVSMLEAAGFEVLWRRVVDDELGGKTGFVLARKTGRPSSRHPREDA